MRDRHDCMQWIILSHGFCAFLRVKLNESVHLEAGFRIAIIPLLSATVAISPVN